MSGLGPGWPPGLAGALSRRGPLPMGNGAAGARLGVGGLVVVVVAVVIRASVYGGGGRSWSEQSLSVSLGRVVLVRGGLVAGLPGGGEGEGRPKGRSCHGSSARWDARPLLDGPPEVGDTWADACCPPRRACWLVEARSLWAGCAHMQPGGSRGHVAVSWLVVVVVAIWAGVYRGRQLWQQRADQIDCLSHAGPGAGAAKARVARRNWGRRGPRRVHSGAAGVGIVVKER